MRQQKLVTINLGKVRYVYNSPTWDDLNEVCAENLKNWEPFSRKLFRKIARKSKRIIDIGAYTGAYTIESSLSNVNAEVISVEPNPIALKTLQQNIRENQLRNIEIWDFAVGSKENQLPLYSTSDERGNSMTSLIKGNDLEEEILVRVLTLDNLLENKSIDLIKMDVEGFENEVLLGARNVLKRDRPILLTEALTDINLKDQAWILLAENYNFPIKIGDTRGDDRNYLWIPKEKILMYVKMIFKINTARIVNYWRRYV
jgi:FkbM family methyltransferase